MQGRPDVDQALMQSFKDLVKTTPIEKITIKDITDGAGVIRPTFYHHFQDKYEVIERILRQEILEPVQILLDNDMIDEAMVLIYTNLQNDRDYYLKLVRMEGQNSFAEIARACVEELLNDFFVKKTEKKIVKDKWLTPSMLAKYYAQSMVFVVVNWLESGMPLSPGEIAEVYNYMITHSMKDMIEEIKEQGVAVNEQDKRIKDNVR
jgi:probable dihydroxyacetone kinase regulator